MAMYLFVPGVSGSTTAKGYEQWISILAMDWGAGRIVETTSGNVADRIRSNTTGLEMELIKQLDKTSPLLFAHAWGDKAIPEVQIHACYGGPNAFVPYLQCTLSNVLVSEYSAHVDQDESLELVALNYTDIEYSYTEYDSQGLPNSPNRACAQIGSKPSLSTQCRREIRAGTEEGFKLFVATVYGEMTGVHNSPEKAWQAVGSVIINRVRNGLWRGDETTDAVIKNTGFDAYINPLKIKDWNAINFKAFPAKGHEQFIKAWAHLHLQKINHHLPLNKDEKDRIVRMRDVLEPVYYKRKTVTNANYYYSPRGMHGRTPSFLLGIENPEQYRVLLAGLNENEIKLYCIPAKVERRAGYKVRKKK